MKRLLLPLGLLLVALLLACDPVVTPTPAETPTPATACEAWGTRIAQIEQTVVVWETVMPDVMQTAEALYYLSLTPTPDCGAGCGPTPTPTPALCQRCLTGADCPVGYTCRTCATCYQLCVRLSSPNGDCNNCLNAGPIK